MSIFPIEHGKITPVCTFTVSGKHFGSHILGFFFFTVCRIQFYQFTGGFVCPQFLAFAFRVVSDDRIGCVQNMPGGTVILLQAYTAAALIPFFKREDIFDGSPSEFVDTLIIITDDADVFVFSGNQG